MKNKKIETLEERDKKLKNIHFFCYQWILHII